MKMEELKPLIFGGTIKEEEPGVFGFQRFTDRQIEHFKYDANLEKRVRCTAGVSMDFYTDAFFIRLEYEVYDMSDRDILQMDLYQNQVMKKFLYESPAIHTKGEFYYPIEKDGQEFNRITIWFPYMSQIRIKKIEFSEGAILKPLTEKRKKLLAVGDSITQGYDACCPSQTYIARFARFFDMELWNTGISGYVFEAEVLDRELPFEPDIVTCAFGTNDWCKAESREKLFENAKEYFDRLLHFYPFSEHIYISPLWRRDGETETHIGNFWETRKKLMEIAREKGIYVVDGLYAVPNIPEAFADLKLHPNDNGMACYSEYLVKMYLKKTWRRE